MVLQSNVYGVIEQADHPIAEKLQPAKVADSVLQSNGFGVTE
jgi:hypothetical protein